MIHCFKSNGLELIINKYLITIQKVLLSIGMKKALIVIIIAFI